jgi:hypothetical protein
MNRFLWGAGFEGLTRDFGRPVVRQWTGLAFERGPASDAAPNVATRRIEAIAPDSDPTEVIGAALVATRERARATTVHSTALAIDTRAWELVHFTLGASPAPEDAGTAYEVLHLSSPHFDQFKAGRQW